MMCCWIAEVLTKAFKSESNMWLGKDVRVHQASDALLVPLTVDAFIIWSCRTKTALTVNRHFSRLMLVMLRFYSLQDYFEVGGLVHPNKPVDLCHGVSSDADVIDVYQQKDSYFVMDKEARISGALPEALFPAEL